jgi:Zn-dependent peptidase ImmA (M78 family)
MNSGAIEKLAHKHLIDFWETKGKPDVAAFFPVDAQGLIKAVLGWECEAKDMVAIDLTPGFNVLGRCSVDKNGRHLVEVATKEMLMSGSWSDPCVQRFTWAHEAGHIALSHIDPQKNIYECRRVRSAIKRKEQRYKVPEEMMADIFARALLMPEKAVRDRFKQSFAVERVWATRSAYAEHLKVSPSFDAEISAENLAEGLVTHRNGSGESICQFFGVSRSAAKRRLTELGIVFP